MTVLVTTHYMDEADQHCDRIALMHRGRIRAQGTPAELKAMRRRATPRWTTCSARPPATTSVPTLEKGCAMSAPLDAPPADSVETVTIETNPHRLRRRLTLSRDGHDVPGGAAEAAPRPDRTGHPRDPARAVAADLRRDVHPAARHPHRRRALPGLPGARHPRPVGAVRLDLLRHPDHLGARRGRAGQAAGHADPADRAGHRQGVRGRGACAGAGAGRAGAGRDPRRRPDREPVEAARRRASW